MEFHKNSDNKGLFTHSMLCTCRAHAAPMPFRSRAVPLRVYNVIFPFDLHSAACLIHTCHAMLCPCCSSQGHGTARPSRDGLWATCPRSTSSGYHAEFHEGWIRTIPISDAGGQCGTKQLLSWTRKRAVAAHYKKIKTAC